MLIDSERDAIAAVHPNRSLTHIQSSNVELLDGTRLAPLKIRNRALILILEKDYVGSGLDVRAADIRECEYAVLLRQPTAEERRTWDHEVAPKVFELLLLHRGEKDKTIFSRTSRIQVWGQVTIT